MMKKEQTLHPSSLPDKHQKIYCCVRYRIYINSGIQNRKRKNIIEYQIYLQQQNSLETVRKCNVKCKNYPNVLL